jgi:hypothetical protein
MKMQKDYIFLLMASIINLMQEIFMIVCMLNLIFKPKAFRIAQANIVYSLY